MLDQLVLQMPVFDANNEPTEDREEVVVRFVGDAIQVVRGKGHENPAVEIEVTRTGLRVFQYACIGDDPVVVLQFDKNKTKVSSNYAVGPLSFDDINLEHEQS